MKNEDGPGFGNGWERIAEDAARSVTEPVTGFDGPAGVYRVHVRPEPPHVVEVPATGIRERWVVGTAETRQGVPRLSGILDVTAWVMLTMGPAPVIEYRGDGVLIRRDTHTG